jgi:hypothetical protein
MRRLGAVTATAACALVAGCGGGGGDANYQMAPTVKCLRAHGFTVSNKSPWPTYWVVGKRDRIIAVRHSRSGMLADVLVFTPSAAQAKRDSDAARFGRITKRNVVFDTEPEASYADDPAVVGCLRSR